MAALTQSELEARITAIRKSIDSGVLIVRHGDESTQFRSISEMERILLKLQNELDALLGTAPRTRVRYIEQGGKGF